METSPSASWDWRCPEGYALCFSLDASPFYYAIRFWSSCLLQLLHGIPKLMHCHLFSHTQVHCNSDLRVYVSCLTSLIFCRGRFTVLLAWYTLANTFAAAFPVKSLQSVELFCPTGCCLSAHLWADKAAVSFSDLEMLSSPAISNWSAVFSSVQRNVLADFDIWFLIWVDLFLFLLGITH